MNTPDTEWAFAQEIQDYYFERGARLKKEDWDWLKEKLTTRDTYWKERVRKEVERIEDEVRDLKRRSDSSTYLYGQGESNAYETVLKLLTPITNEDNLK